MGKVQGAEVQSVQGSSPLHPLLADFLLAWRERTKYAKESDYVFPSVKLRGKKPLSASIMVRKYLRPAAISVGVISADRGVPQLLQHSVQLREVLAARTRAYVATCWLCFQCLQPLHGF